MAGLPEGFVIDQPQSGVPEGYIVDGAPESFLTTPAAVGEAGAAIATGLAGTVAGGIAGAGTLLTGGGLSAASDNIQKVQELLTREPTTQAGKDMLQSISETVEGVVRTIEGGVGAGVTLRGGGTLEEAGQTFSDVKEKGAGEVVFEKTGSPALSTAAEIGVDTALLATPLGRVKGVPKTGRKALHQNKKTTPEQKQIIKQFSKDEITLEEAMSKLDALGEHAVIADVGGANISAQAKGAGAATRKGREARDAGVIDREATMLNEALDKAGGYYDVAYAQKVAPTESLLQKLNSPSVTESGVIKDAIKLINAKSSTKLTPEQRALGLSMFDGAGGIRFENLNMVGLDHLKRALRQKAGGTKVKKAELSVAYKDAGAALRDELVLQSSAYENALKVWTEYSVKAEKLGETIKATSVSNSAQIAMQEAMSFGDLPTKIGGMTTDALFALNQNRFAILRLIQDTAKLGRRKGKIRERSGKEAEILYDPKKAKAELQEMIEIVGTKPKAIQIASKLNDTRLVRWLESKQNRRALYEYAARAAVIERKGNQ